MINDKAFVLSRKPVNIDFLDADILKPPYEYYTRRKDWNDSLSSWHRLWRYLHGSHLSSPSTHMSAQLLLLNSILIPIFGIFMSIDLIKLICKRLWFGKQTKATTDMDKFYFLYTPEDNLI
jgi:hypothetical protein